MNQSEKEQHYHNKGEQDYAEGKGYNEPWGDPGSVAGTNTKEQTAQNNAYRDGYRNARKQDGK